MYATSRIIAAVARAHLLPPFLARVHHKLGTPYVSTILSGVAAAVMALFTGMYAQYARGLVGRCLLRRLAVSGLLLLLVITTMV
jgi:APA family basic amino acid/polyamine antiporter